MNRKLVSDNTSDKLPRRIVAFFIDIVAISFVMGIILAVIISLCEMNVALAILCAAVCTSALLCKDILRPSIGKRIMKMDIVSRDKSKTAAWKLIVRNLTLGLWFIEFIIVSYSKGGTRFTDKKLGLEVVYY